jgi:hypothetical protein
MPADYGSHVKKRDLTSQPGAGVVAVTQNDLRLAVHHDPGRRSKPWAVGVETGPGKLQVLDRYESEVGANRVLKRLLPMFRKHARRPT